MSKPNTPKAQSSILSFFGKTPPRKVLSEVKPEVVSQQQTPSDRKRATKDIDESPEIVSPSRQKKKRRVVISSDEEEPVVDVALKTPVNTSTKAGDTESGGKRSTPRHRMILLGSDDEEDNYEAVKTPAAPKSPARATPKTTPRRSAVQKTPKKAATSQDQTVGGPSADQYLHETFEFLKPDKIKDINNNRPGDPNYDAKTLFVPESFFKEQTPGHKQWWAVKQMYFDTVLFFKVGKFYELYHMDAIIGGECLDLTMVRGKFAHVGFPEISFGKFADMLYSRGYKVARVEQTETPDMLEARNKKEKSKVKVVRREVCRVTTASTKTYGVYDGSDDKNFMLSVEPSASYLMAFVEKVDEKFPTYGVALIDTSVGRFILSQFTDDSCRSTLRTLLANYQPCHILHLKNSLSKPTLSILNSILSNVEREPLFDKREFYTPDKVVNELMLPKYLTNVIEKWPKELSTVFDLRMHVPVPLEGKEMAVKALGGLLFYLQRCLIDVDMLTMARFEEYIPPMLVPGTVVGPIIKGSQRWKKKNLIIDGATLLNLHLVPPFSGKKTGNLRDPSVLFHSLYVKMDKCKTPFGKRLLRQWICSPSCDPDVIYGRQAATQFLMNYDNKVLFDRIQQQLNRMPDLERLVQKIHTLGLKYRRDTHPDGRAFMFFKNNYDKRKINDLLTALNGFDRILTLARFFQSNVDESCELIENCLGTGFCDISTDLKHFKEAFNQDKALEAGHILPFSGMDQEYDEAVKQVYECEKRCNEFCASENQKWKTSGISLHGTGKARFILEVPENVASKLDNKYSFKSQKKGYKRFEHPALTELSKRLFEAEEKQNLITADITRRVFEDFADRKLKWNKVVMQMATLDCLCSFATYAKDTADIVDVCCPEFDFESDEPSLDVRKGNHPLLIGYDVVLAKGSRTRRYVANDTCFGKDSQGKEHSLSILLTGPNMGGKSTIMRQTAVLIVMAQMGCLVPAKSMKLTPADRIFSRIGAHDCSFAGQSTFYVELDETKSIIKNATRDSFIVIDELGRGTSTNDGTAIAGAVLKELANHLKSRMFFSTHYFQLCDLVQGNGNVRLAHMSFVVNNENLDDPTEEEIIFHYTLVDGACKKSYGFNAAKLAGMPSHLIREAHSAAHLLEEQQKRFKQEQVDQKKLRYLMDLRARCMRGDDLDVVLLSKQIEAL